MSIYLSRCYHSLFIISIPSFPQAPCGVVTGTQALRYMGLQEPNLPGAFYPAVFLLAAYLCGQIVTVIAFIASKKPNRVKKYRTE